MYNTKYEIHFGISIKSYSVWEKKILRVSLIFIKLAQAPSSFRIFCVSRFSPYANLSFGSSKTPKSV